jgi:hypothetical protein
LKSFAKLRRGFRRRPEVDYRPIFTIDLFPSESAIVKDTVLDGFHLPEFLGEQDISQTLTEQTSCAVTLASIQGILSIGLELGSHLFFVHSFGMVNYCKSALRPIKSDNDWGRIFDAFQMSLRLRRFENPPVAVV